MVVHFVTTLTHDQNMVFQKPSNILSDFTNIGVTNDNHNHSIKKEIIHIEDYSR